MGQSGRWFDEEGGTCFCLPKRKSGVLTDGGGSILPIPRKEQSPSIVALSSGKFLFRIAGVTARFVRKHPDLIELSTVFFGGIELAMSQARSGTHVLQVARTDDGAITHAVPVLQFAGNYVGKDLRVLVGMSGETTAWFNDIVIHHDQGMKTAVLRIVIIGEGEGKIGMQPAMISVSPLGCSSYFYVHIFKLTVFLNAFHFLSEVIFQRSVQVNQPISRLAKVQSS